LECPQKQQHAGDRGGKSTEKKNVAFTVHVMGASSASIVDADSRYCDSGATWHIVLNKHYFVSYTKFANPETIVLGKKKCADASMQSKYDKHPDVSQWRVA